MKISLKSLTLSFLDRILNSGSYRGTGNSFFGRLSFDESYTGISVNQDTALTFTAYWACVRLLTETLASLPLLTLRRLERGKERATDHPLYRLLHDAPNPEMDSFTYFETLMYHLCAADGNCYSLIEYEPDKLTIKALWPMRPDRTEKTRNAQGQIVFNYQSENGQLTFPDYMVWHVPGLGYDGQRGYTPIAMAKQSIGLGLATEKFGATFFGNGTNMGGFLEHPGSMTTPAQERLKKSIIENKSGLNEAHKWVVLEEGMKAAKNVIPPEDAQFLETRKFQRSEMASFFHVPPHMIGDLERATFSNIEEQALEFVVYTMRPWLVRFERSAKRKLFTEPEQDSLFAEFLVDALLRGNFESRTRGYWQAIQGGWMSPNEVREMENKNPREGGDDYLQPVNMVVSGQTPPQADRQRNG